MIRNEQVQDIMANDTQVLDQEGQKVGKVGQVYLDYQTNEPEWATVKTGLFGGSESFVPLHGANLRDGDLVVQCAKDSVKDAPRIDADQHLEPEQEEELYRYYGLSDTAASMAGDPEASAGQGGQEKGQRQPAGDDVSGPNTDDAMTRSEERVNVSAEQRETGRARLRKHVVTEDVHTTVPVSREEVHVTREPITEANQDQAQQGPQFSEEEHEVTLHEEVPVVDKETVPVERVRLEKETVTDQAEVDEEVRKERIETEGAEDTDDRRG